VIAPKPVPDLQLTRPSGQPTLSPSHPGGVALERWRAKLSEGDPDAAWDLFIDRYRRLILATIRRTLGSDEDLLEVFAEVCRALAANDLERLSRYVDSSAHKARFSTWLVAVVHNQTIDWIRSRDGRVRIKVPPGLTPIQEQLFEQIFVQRRTHAEAFELMRASTGGELSFGAFLKAVADTYRAIERARSRGALHYLAGGPPAREESTPGMDPLELSELGSRLEEVLRSLPDDERLALQLFVIDEVPAADVARLVGWPNAKAVYNRVYRALQSLRSRLEHEGISLADL
jgi:RNA polymerase sigma factor (sigma-70 family)